VLRGRKRFAVHLFTGYEDAIGLVDDEIPVAVDLAANNSADLRDLLVIELPPDRLNVVDDWLDSGNMQSVLVAVNRDG
jgi:hypothetical protein